MIIVNNILPTLNGCRMYGDRPVVISTRELREAAMKWIVELTKSNGISQDNASFDFDNQLDDFQNLNDEYNEVIEWIKWFFNITNEDIAREANE